MNKSKMISSDVRYLVVFSISLIFLIVGIVFLIVFNRNSHFNTVELETLRAEEHYTKVLNEIFSEINSIEVFTESVHPTRISQERFDTFMLDSNSQNFIMINASIAIGGVQTYVYPLEGNESVLDIDILNDERDYVREAVAEAIETDLIIINGPYELRQGGNGIVFRKAAFYENEFYAIVNIVVDYDELKEHLNNLNSTVVDVGVFDSLNKLIFGTVTFDSSNNSIHSIDSQNVSWDIIVIENESFHSRYIFNTTLTIVIMIILYLLLVVTGVTMKKRDKENLREQFKLINFDNLTQLPNRSMMIIQLNELIKNNIPFYLGFGDLDNFKDINDILGHSIGDEYLKEIAERFSSVSDSKLEIFRWGGDEFVFLYRTDKYEEIINVLEVIYNQTIEPIIINENEYHISMSLGIVRFPNDGLEIDELIKKADIVMYDTKEKEKNNYAFFENRFQESLEKQVEFENLIQSFTTSDIELYLQPILDVETDEVVGFEALSRLFDKDNNIINTIDFIKHYEKNGKIRELDLNTFMKVCRISKAFEKEFEKEYIFSFNISPISLSKDLINEFEKLIEKYKINPNNFIVEIIETTGFKDLSESLIDLDSLKNLGFKIAMDDFGKGYSSLSYITQLPLNYIKIDKEFIEHYEHNDFDRLLILAIKELSKALNLKIIVEGIETEKQLDFIKTVECDLYQGYLHSKPMCIVDILNLLRKINK